MTSPHIGPHNDGFWVSVSPASSIYISWRRGERNSTSQPHISTVLEFGVRHPPTEEEETTYAPLVRLTARHLRGPGKYWERCFRARTQCEELGRSVLL